MSIAIAKLTPEQRLETFSSRRPALDDWLKRRALQVQRSDTAVTYVAVLGRIVGYVSLASGSVMPDDMNERIRKGVAGGLPIPTLLLARLAIDIAFESQGIGSTLLLHAMRLVVAVADQVGIRSLVVNPIDDEAFGFCAKFDFQTLEGVHPPMMYLLTKDVRKLVATYDAALERARHTAKQMDEAPSGSGGSR